jgi:hypothetical protein
MHLYPGRELEEYVEHEVYDADVEEHGRDESPPLVGMLRVSQTPHPTHAAHALAPQLAARLCGIGVAVHHVFLKVRCLLVCLYILNCLVG